jgi:hypothetical protein
MAEHLNQSIEPAMIPFNAMGKSIPQHARAVGYDHCKSMGLDSARSWECVNGVAEQLERDKPYEAQAAGMKFLDLTGTYRLMAAILTQAATEPAIFAGTEGGVLRAAVVAQQGGGNG